MSQELWTVVTVRYTDEVDAKVFSSKDKALKFYDFKLREFCFHFGLLEEAQGLDTPDLSLNSDLGDIFVEESTWITYEKVKLH